MNATTLINGIIDAFNAHTTLPAKPSKAFRKHDGRTPYFVHPTWCAMTILHELALPVELRVRGSLVLQFHDVLEDTLASLPSNLPADVVEGINHMTFPGGSAQEQVELWEKPLEIQLFKAYDKVANLLDGFNQTPEKAARADAHARRLLGVVEDAYGTLNIVKNGRALLGEARG